MTRLPDAANQSTSPLELLAYSTHEDERFPHVHHRLDSGRVPSEHPGETGMALWRTQIFGEIRVRMVEYSPGYTADHWCSKGPHSSLSRRRTRNHRSSDGTSFTLTPGKSYQVADGESSHRSSTKTGAKLFIVD